MSLTKQDLTDIQGIVLDALDTVVNPRFDRIEKQLDEHSAILDKHSELLHEHSELLHEHSDILAEHGRRLTAIEEKVDNIDGRLRAIEADIKELYRMVSISPALHFDKTLTKLPPEKQVVELYSAVISLAKQLHVEL